MDYYPYGKTLREYQTGVEKYLTTQHERDAESGLDYRGARFYDSDIARFLSLDPLAAEYVSLSPYNYVAGNPVFYIDPDGKRIVIGKWYQFAFRARVKTHLRSISRNSTGADVVNFLKNAKRKDGKELTVRIIKTDKASGVVPSNPNADLDQRGRPNWKKDGMEQGVASERSGTTTMVGNGLGAGSVLQLNEGKSAKGGEYYHYYCS